MSIRVGIVGISGYGGGEALRLCSAHPVFRVAPLLDYAIYERQGWADDRQMIGIKTTASQHATLDVQQMASRCVHGMHRAFDKDLLLSRRQ